MHWRDKAVFLGQTDVYVQILTSAGLRDWQGSTHGATIFHSRI